MGRLTLNMLPSFAQFEREVTGERIRDKIAASKKKGIWVGGVVPLGYRVVERKLVIEQAEAESVRFIFRRYLELGALGPLIDDLKHKGIATRIRTLASGRVVGGVPFTRGPLAYLLKNRMYLGEINHGANSYPGEHPPILDRDVFDAVQAKLAAQAVAIGFRRSPSDAFLTGKLFDPLGRPMTPTYAVKAGVRYRYYLSRRGTGSTEVDAAPIVRASAPDIEDAVLKAIASIENGIATSKRVNTGGPIATDPLVRHPSAIRDVVKRIDIRSGKIEIVLVANAMGPDRPETIAVPWSKPPTRVRREVIAPVEGQWSDPRAMSSDTRSRLLSTIALSRCWLDDLVSGRVADIEKMAVRECRSPRSVTMLLSLAFLTPDLVKAIVDNRMPRGIGLTQLMDLPCEWSEQRRAIGMAQTCR
jgi:hypothetical protein